MTIIHGDCLDVMKTFPDNHFSAIVTDPPYGLSFMGKGWDHAIPGFEYWKECLRICKPGSYLLAMGGTRTFHKLATQIEDSGFEIRDCLMWIYGSGFPKSHNHFGIEGYGTALKPAYEPIIMAMKPLDGTFKQNAAKWGQAGINIDGCRIGVEDRVNKQNQKAFQIWKKQDGRANKIVKNKPDKACIGRWPANILLDEEAAEMLDEQSGTLHGTGNKKLRIAGKGNKSNSCFGIESGAPNCLYDRGGGASRFFYCAKASRSERNYGLDEFEDKPLLWSSGSQNPGSFQSEGTIKSAKNNHPTVKPLKLMEYLIKLVMPPKDGLLLDPFAGSGTTILAAKRLGFESIGIEKSEEYCEIARKRLETCDKEPKQMDLLEALKQKTSP